ncbi:hypothetical protein [Streptomyces gobitricini]
MKRLGRDAAGLTALAELTALADRLTAHGTARSGPVRGSGHSEAGGGPPCA